MTHSPACKCASCRRVSLVASWQNGVLWLLRWRELVGHVKELGYAEKRGPPASTRPS
jgi:hypothetical protein